MTTKRKANHPAWARKARQILADFWRLRRRESPAEARALWARQVQWNEGVAREILLPTLKELVE